MRKITDDDIKRAKNADMTKLLDREGIAYEKIKNSKYYRLVEHDSLNFNYYNGKWMFFWNSKKVNGNIIKFVEVYFSKKDFNEICGFINGEEYEKCKPKVEAPGLDADTEALIDEIFLNEESNVKSEDADDEPKVIVEMNPPKRRKHNAYEDNDDGDKPFVMPKLASNTKKVYGYLINSRMIDAEIVSKLTMQKLILQEKLMVNGKEINNVVFPFVDENGNIVGAERRETYNLNGSKFKNVMEGSKYGYGFNIQIGETADVLYFFESTIDLMSFWTLFPNIDNVALISMAGLKECVIEHYEQFYCQDSICLCVDNDDAGRKFYDKVKELYPLADFWNYDNDDVSKDWNEHMIRYKQCKGLIPQKEVS